MKNLWFCCAFTAHLVRQLSDYEIVVPRKVSHDGKHLSHRVIHHYDGQQRRRRRSIESGDDDEVHYRLVLDGRERHLHLAPNDRLLSPGFVIERRNVTEHRIRTSAGSQCHYVGHVRGQPGSTAAVSTCQGLVSRFFSFFLTVKRSVSNPVRAFVNI